MGALTQIFDRNLVKKCVYVGAFLTEESRKRLLEAFPPKYPNIYAHHCTVEFKPDLEKYEKIIGEEVQLLVVGHSFDNYAEAVVVHGSCSVNDEPHITISCSNGTKPVHSNAMLAEGWNPLIQKEKFIKLDARIGVFGEVHKCCMCGNNATYYTYDDFFCKDCWGDGFSLCDETKEKYNSIERS